MLNSKKLFKKCKSINTYLLFLLTTFLTWGTFFIYIWPKLLYFNKQGDLVAGWINVWGDFPAHFVYSSPFAYREITHWFLANPIYILSKFNYPFLADAISGLLIRFGFNIVYAFILPSILLSLLFLFIFYKLAFKLSKSGIVSFLSINIFLFGGGLGFVHFLNYDLYSFLSTFTIVRQYTQLKELKIAFINPITSELLPQRAFLLGLPITLLILHTLYSWCVIKFKNVNSFKIILLGLLSGLLPVIHMHSFIALFVFCIFMFFYNIRLYKKFLIYAFFTLIPTCLIFYLFFYKSINASSFIQFYPGWMANSKELNQNYFIFVFYNFGLFLPLAILSFFYFKLYKNYLYVGAFVLFILTQTFKFQPWAWDNTKLITYWYLFFSIAISNFLVKYFLQIKNFNINVSRFSFYATYILKLITFKVLLLILIFSGFLDVLNLLNYKNNSHTIISANELLVASKVNNLISSNSVVLTATAHNHLISNHTKAQVLMGYYGWLWSYGIESNVIYNDLKLMYENPAQNTHLFKKYNVKYVFISNSERSEFNVNEEYYSKLEILYLNNSFNLVILL